MRLKFMEQLPLKPELMTCSYCGKSQRIGGHSRQERRSICHACGKTFVETQGNTFLVSITLGRRAGLDHPGARLPDFGYRSSVFN